MCQVYLTRGGYSRLGLIRVRAGGGLYAYARTNKSRLASCNQPDTYPKSLPFASGCQQNVAERD